MKFKDMLINVTLAIIAIITFLWTLMTGGWTKEVITLISVLGGKVAQSVTALMAAQTRYTGMMAKELQAKSANSQTGMLMHLMESMEDQECKEMILSYAVLAANGKSMTLKEIDAKCEYELYDRFRLKIDFDVEGAMVKLLREGLVEQRAGVLYTATPLKKALKRLDTKWDNLFDYRDTAARPRRMTQPCSWRRRGRRGIRPWRRRSGNSWQTPTRNGSCGRKAQGAARGDREED